LVQRYPFQAVGLEVGLVAYAAWLRIEARYSIGYMFEDQGAGGFNSYAEALVGFRLLGAASERHVDLRPDDETPWYRRERVRPPPTLEAALPSFHQLFLEAGMMTGSVIFERCAEDCTPTPSQGTLTGQAKQLFFPLAGLRYIYLISVSSERQKQLTRRLLIEWSAHLLVSPFPRPDQDLWSNRQTVGRHPLGARVEIDFPACLAGCVSFGFMGGYLPTPGSPLFGVTLKSPVF
jgi:hypothetical protein